MRLAGPLLGALMCLTAYECLAACAAPASADPDPRHSRAGGNPIPSAPQVEIGFPPARERRGSVDVARRQAEDGDAAAAYRLGLMYRNGSQVAQDKALAAYWVGVAAERGVTAAMFTLSNMLGEGEGVAMDQAASRRWLEAAAELEYPEALQQLALTDPDPARAALLMKQAAHAMTHRAR